MSNKNPVSEHLQSEENKRKAGHKKALRNAIRREAKGITEAVGTPKEDSTTKKSNPNSKESTKVIQAIRRQGTALQEALRNGLNEIQEDTGHPYYIDFINNVLTAAKDDPNCPAAKFLITSMFAEDVIQSWDKELDKQISADKSFLNYRIRDTLYDKQREVFDNNTDQQIGVICTRRAGKTELAARVLLKYALSQDKVRILYLNRSFDNAVNQMAQPLRDLMKELNISYKGTDEFTLTNESVIMFGGFNNKGDIDRYRGYKFLLIWLDEIGHLRNPKSLIEEVLEPAQIDYGSKAKLIMSGTPPRTKMSYAYQMWHNNNIKHYHWSFMDNPFIPEKDQVIEKVCKQHGLTVDSPFIQREYFGNMEAFDTDAMVFRGYKIYDEVPKQTATRAWIGVDWGFEDEAAVIATVVINNTLYEVESWSGSKRSISEICEIVRDMRERTINTYRPSKGLQIICDTNEKSAVYELSFTYKLSNVYCAYKYDKQFAIDQMAEWMRVGDIQIAKDGKLAAEADSTVYKRDEVSDAIIHEIDDDTFHPNALFALLYISRQYAFEVKGLTERNKEVKPI